MLHKMQLEWGKVKKFCLPVHREAFGEMCVSSIHISCIKHIQEPSKAMLSLQEYFYYMYLFCKPVCAMLGSQHMCADWRTAGTKSLSCPPRGCQDWTPALRLGSKGLYSRSHLAGPRLPTFLKTITVTGREAGKGPPAWGEVRLCQHYIHEQFEKTNTFQEVLKAQTRLAILFFHPHFLFQSCPLPFTLCIPFTLLCMDQRLRFPQRLNSADPNSESREWCWCCKGV